jgi:hypothetical protein
MKEAKIIAFIGIYGSLILSTTSTDKIMSWLFVVIAIYWLGKYISLINIK